MRVRMKTYGPSRSGAALARELGILRLREPTRFRPRTRDRVINWGCSSAHYACRVINEAAAVHNATDKVASLTRFTTQGVPCPAFTTSRETANEWFNDGEMVVARSLTRGSGGRGIILCDPEATDPMYNFPTVPLYTKYVKKRDEYRVFVVAGRVIRITHKRRRSGLGAEGGFAIRNSENGWVYCQEGTDCPEPVAAASLRAVGVLGLDFGAVDVGWNAHYERACVYEVNTAFGIEGTTLTVVADAMREAYL